MENHLILNEPKLTYLGLQGFGGNNALIATLILLSKNLTTLDLSEADFALLSHVLNKIDRTNRITLINLSIMSQPLLQRAQRVGNEQSSALGEMYSPIRANIIADLTTKCIRLTDLVLCGANLSQDAIIQICQLVTPTLIAINLARERVKDEHVESLTLRCPNMRYINLAQTKPSPSPERNLLLNALSIKETMNTEKPPNLPYHRTQWETSHGIWRHLTGKPGLTFWTWSLVIYDPENPADYPAEVLGDS